MSVGSICNHNVATIDVDADMVEAAKRMRGAHVGDLVVTDHREGHTIPIGMITDRDIVVEVVAKGVDPDQVKVGETMSRDLVAVHDDSSIEYAIEYALREMQRRGVRRVPVVNGSRELIGILAMDDAVGHLAVQFDHIAGAIRMEQYKESQARP